MAKSPNNGALSGVLGNVVFVNQGPRSFIRSKPNGVRQSKATKAAASTFGWVSQQDKKFRWALSQACALVTDPYYSARHRACMAKALAPLPKGIIAPASLEASLPQALVNFEFNDRLPWGKTCSFYPTFVQTANTLTCHMPALTLGQHIKAPESVRAAYLQLDTLLVDPTLQDVDVIPLAQKTYTLLPHETIPESEWVFDIPTSNTWLLVLGTIRFEYRQGLVAPHLGGTATYLFAKVV